MIELDSETLKFHFPDVHDDALLHVEFQRTLRIPDDDSDHPLPPGLGCFPMRHVDDFAERLPEAWGRHGGVMLPMYQSEAMWLNFSSPHGYPFALKVAAGKINAVTGDEWDGALQREPQDYLSIPDQPWLDGFCVEEGVVRQFVAMPLGAGFSAEEQLTGKAEHGGLQLIAYPLKAKHYRARLTTGPSSMEPCDELLAFGVAPEMSLAPGGRMRQEIYEDHRPFDHWDRDHSSRCFVHLANSQAWKTITGARPPTRPPTAKAYTRAGLPWFDYYSDGEAVKGSGTLRGLKSVKQKLQSLVPTMAVSDEPVHPKKVVRLGKPPRRRAVREGTL